MNTLRAKQSNWHDRFTRRGYASPSSFSRHSATAPSWHCNLQPFQPVQPAQPAQAVPPAFNPQPDGRHDATFRGQYRPWQTRSTGNRTYNEQRNAASQPSAPPASADAAAPQPARAYTGEAEPADDLAHSAPTFDDDSHHFFESPPVNDDTDSTTCFTCSAAFSSTNRLHRQLPLCSDEPPVAQFSEPGPVVQATPTEKPSLPGYQFRHWRYATL